MAKRVTKANKDAERARPFNLVAVVQGGRLASEVLLLAASLRENDPSFRGKLYLLEPQPGPRWSHDPRLPQGALRERLLELGAEFIPFESRFFGGSYPYGNKIEGLTALPREPFLFLDSDTLITGALSQLPLDFSRPSASMRCEGTWPQLELYGPGYGAIWKSLYDRFGLDFESSLDPAWPDEYWRRYLYFNAGWFFGADPVAFGERFTAYAREIRDNPPTEAALQSFDPWLDQVALPLVIHSFGGGRPGPELAGLDGDVTCHWRALPLLYARESEAAIALMEKLARENANKKHLREFMPFKKLVYQGHGARVRALFDQDALPRREQMIRNTIKRAGLWQR